MPDTPGFVDGIDGASILEELWPLVRKTTNTAIAALLLEIIGGVKLLATRNLFIAQGAGAEVVATAAMSERASLGDVVCMVSGGNIDPLKRARILMGETLQ